MTNTELHRFRKALTAVPFVLFLSFWLSTPVLAQLGQTAVPSSRALSRYGLEKMWSGQAMLNASRDTVRYITLDEDNVYVQSSSGITTAFDAETGKRRWSVLLGRTDGWSYPAASNEHTLMIVVDMTLYALDKLSGDVLWQLDLPANPSAGPAVDKELVYVGMLDGSVYAFKIRKIDELFSKQLLPQWSHYTIAWRFQAFKQVTSPPISTERTAIFATRGGLVYSIGSQEGKLVYEFETDGAISAPIVEAKDTLLVASEDFNFYALDASNGNPRWEFVSGLPIRQGPKVVGNDVYLLPDRGGLGRLELDTGKQIWWRPKITSFLASTKSLVYAFDAFENLVVIDRQDGAVLGAMPLRGFSVPLPNTRTDRIFVATAGGLVLALRETGREFPVYHRYPDRQPILPEFAPEQPEATPANNQ